MKSLDSILDGIYSRMPEGERRPVIGITSNHSDIDATVRERYYLQVVEAGGVPVIIPPVSDHNVILETLERIDALILTGGADIDPAWVGEERSPKLGNVNAVRDLPELLITRFAYNRQVPMLGICRGCQTIAMALGGHVAQDISERKGAEAEALQHSQSEERDVTTHGISIVEDSLLYNIYNKVEMNVNSFHHQSVDEAGSLFRVTATAPDGVVECIESTELKPIIGVQWHPEWLGEDGRRLFSWLVDEARLYQKAKSLHNRIVTLDSHCDTPMFFPQGADFSQRDSRILVDVHKMTDGRQDAVTMVAYVPQDMEGSAFQYANDIFDRVEQIVNAHPESMAMARTYGDLMDNKRRGLKSVMLGIENAKAIEDDIRNVDYFHKRGAVYYTLCHNGDNQICDSARRSQNTWGGVSPFGEQVIRRMNELGVTVDLSHAGEKSFYDAIEISRCPVVCSHSNCKALCNHERNLTDDQLRTLAKHDGVCQVTLYHGFLNTASTCPSEASILDAIAHLNHAVDIMGIDHVGLGTDFDGDGGVLGLKDSSEMLLFTRQLLRNRYSDEDIEKIWGLNWIRRVLY